MIEITVGAKIDWFLRQNSSTNCIDSASESLVKIFLDKPLSCWDKKADKVSFLVPKGYYWFGGITLSISLLVLVFAIFDFIYKITSLGALVYISAFLSSLALFLTDLVAIRELKRNTDKTKRRS